MKLEQKTLKRFWSKIDYSTKDNCWNWKGTLSNRGYGFFSIKGKSYLAHRLMWQIENKREIPKSVYVCHHCDNPSCVNPDHLFLGNDLVNMSDKMKKGRWRGKNGIKRWNQRNDAEVLAMHKDGKNIWEISEHFGYSRPIIANVLYRHGIKTFERFDYDKETCLEIYNLNRSGITYDQLADNYGVGRGVITRAIQVAKSHLRGNSRYNRKGINSRRDYSKDARNTELSNL